MSRYFTKITKEELAVKILEAAMKTMDPQYDGFHLQYLNKRQNNFGEKYDKDTDMVEGLGYHLNLKILTPKVEKDLSKVIFDTENLECKKGEGYCNCGEITGLRTLDNGLTFLGITAGGDWENPLFFIIYFDGKDLRGYIPTDGNSWNKKTKTAYGSEGEREGCEESEDEEDEDEGIREDVDTTKVIADITARILPK